ncbi:MAG: BatD family protein [Thermodesulfobacteriota bacterium]|nr:BatD family protein [Thermodesulfobacteriota bacterium]
MVASKQGILYFITISALFLLYSVGWAKSPVSIYLKMDRTEVTPADTVKLMVTIKGEKKASAPSISGLEPFHVRQGGTSSRFQMINGEISRELDYIFYITPKRTGIFIIGPAQVTLKKKTYKSQTLKLTVQDAPSQPGDEGAPFFVTAALSADTGYVGQQFIYTVKFYRTQDVRDISLTPPDVEGLAMKRLGDHKEYISSLQGKNYSVIELRYSLTAERPGSFVLPPTYFKMSVLERQDPFSRRSPFDDSFFGFTRTRPLSLGSNAIEFFIKSLPDEERPQDFSGLIGQFSMKATLLPQEVKENESATFSVIISGKGNVRLIPDLKIPEVEDVRTYADQPVLNVQTGFDGISGTKTMKWALVPQKEGSIRIPIMSLSYFDPNSESYRRIATKPLTLRITQGKNQQKVAITEERIAIKEPVKSEVKMEGIDIFSIHERSEAMKVRMVTYLDTWILCLFLLAPPFGFIVIFGVNRSRRKIEADKKALTKKRAKQKFFKGIKALRGPYQLSDLMRITNLYLNERMGLGGGSLTSNEAYEALLTNGVKRPLTDEAKEILSHLESMVYTGAGEEDKAIKIKENVMMIIKKIDKELQ